MKYEPHINDYVIWKPHIKGWVYYKDSEYITIETMVRPKDDINLNAAPFHANNRLLVICYNNQWKELTYVKSRESVHEEEKNCLAMVGKSIR
jgi:hypothetical protein